MRCLTMMVWALGLGASLTGCIFDEEPPCAIGGGACPGTTVCVDFVCVEPGAADGAPDRGPADGAPDARAADGAPSDRGPAVDGGPPPDARPVDAGQPDGGRPCVFVETCNGLDDDCDGTVDEDARRCDVPETCHWRYRGSHIYLFCTTAMSHTDAETFCVNTLDLAMAVPETCDESDWLFTTGNLTPAPVDWDEANARGRAWWLGLELRFSDDLETVFRVDGRNGPLPDCWGDGQGMDDDLFGESCVDLLYNLDTDDWGWNDDACDVNPQNPVFALCEVPCNPQLDVDGDGETACVDCNDADPLANSDNPDRCAAPPNAGFPPSAR